MDFTVDNLYINLSTYNNNIYVHRDLFFIKFLNELI